MELPNPEQMRQRVFQLDEAYAFHLEDASRRLGWASEQAMAVGVFALILYCRLTCPGGYDAWAWFEDPWFWWVVFSPLFAMDLRQFQHVFYLRRSADRFAPHDASRFLLIAVSECVYKIALCLYLSMPSQEMVKGGSFSLKMAMVPFVVGYVAYFFLGHYGPLEDGLRRAQGCNAVEALISELGRFIEFVLVVSLSIKVEGVNGQMYDWTVAFWPGWGLEAMIALLVLLLVPMLLCFLLSARWSKVVMVAWVTFAAIDFGVSIGLTLTYVAKVLKNDLCPGGPEAAMQLSDPTCRRDLVLAISPWVLGGPLFAVVTTLLNRRLSLALHEAWYATPGSALAPLSPRLGVDVEARPTPKVLFRVTPTFYARDPDPEGLQEDGGSIASRSTTHCSWALSSIAVLAAAGTPRSSAIEAPSSLSVMGSVSSSRHFDHAGSMMSARGACYTEFVEDESLCFICYANRADAVLLECGHAGLCTECASCMMDRQQANCPICRQVIGQVVEVRDDVPVPAHLFKRSPSIFASQGPTSPNSGKACDVEDSGSSLPESLVILGGPPWPLSSRKSAVSVRLVRQYQRPSTR